VAWKSPNVELVDVALSSQQGDSTLYVPVINGTELSGWGSLDPENYPGAVDFARLVVKLRTLDSFQFRDVGFVKIDAEGHELQILQGASDTISLYRPHLMIEVRQNEVSVHALLASWGYEACRLDQIAGVRGSLANVIFRPSTPSPMVSTLGTADR
jgi:FkbM family methyltransferase